MHQEFEYDSLTKLLGIVFRICLLFLKRNASKLEKCLFRAVIIKIILIIEFNLEGLIKIEKNMF